MPESTEKSGLRRRWTQGAVAVAILALAAVQPIFGRQPVGWLFAIGLAGLTAWLAHGWADPRLLDAAILIGLVWAIGLIPVAGAWPIGPGLALNRPGMSGDSNPWEGWSYGREHVEKVSG